VTDEWEDLEREAEERLEELEQELPVFIRGGLKILDAEIQKANPQTGDLIYIARGADGPGKDGGKSYRFVVRTKPAPQTELSSSGPGDLPEDY
jgi:hypothetical protein